MVGDHDESAEPAGELNGFDIANLEMDIGAVDRTESDAIRAGRITIDSGAAESVISPGMLKEIPIRESEGSRAGLCYVAANGGKMPNMGEKHVRFKTKEGLQSSVLFQVTHARKPLASVSRIVAKGNKVVFAPGQSFIENIKTGQRIELVEESGTYHMDVNFLTEGFARQA